MTENLKFGILAFVTFLVVLLAVFRLTRQNRSLRDRIQFPLLALFLLFVVYDSFYISGKRFPAGLFQDYLALLYLFLSILAIRLALLFFFDVFLVRNKRYRAPRLLKQLTGFVLFLIAIVAILQGALHIQVATVLATSAIITVVLGLAMQETLGNLFAGLALHLDPPYHVGDWIHVGDIAGKVEEVTWRATKLRTVNNDYIVIPNGSIGKEKLTNHSFPRIPHATRLEFTTSYNVAPNKVKAVVEEALAHIENVATDPRPDVRVSTYSDYVLTFQLKFYFKDYEFIEPTISAIRRALWYHFRRHDIEIPFPARNIFVHEQEEALEANAKKVNRLSHSLKKVYLFADLDDDERHLVAEHLHEMRFAINETIIHEGARDDSLFIIDQGEVEVFITSANQHRKVLTKLHEGDFFGEMALLTGEKRSASVQAVTDVIVYQLNKEAFKEVIETRPLILDEIGSVLSRRKDQLTELMMEITGNPREVASMSPQDAKSRILGRIRSYFGL